MNVIYDKSLNIELRNSTEYPFHFISMCGRWLHTTARPNYLRYYQRNKNYNYLKCCRAKYYLHRLVGLAWVFNPCPGVFDKIDHIDRDSQMNHASNLRWVTQQLNCFNRKVKGYEKIVKKNGAVFYRSRVIVEGNAISKFCRTADDAIRETDRVQRESFDRIYKQHVDGYNANGAVNSRAPHHFLWTDREKLETPEGFEFDMPGVREYCETRSAKFTIHDIPPLAL